VGAVFISRTRTATCSKSSRGLTEAAAGTLDVCSGLAMAG
jgi:hypothetical protein